MKRNIGAHSFAGMGKRDKDLAKKKKETAGHKAAAS